MLHIIQAVISAKIVSLQLRQWKPPCVLAKDCWKTVSCKIIQWCISPRMHLWFTNNKQNHWFMVVDYMRHYCAEHKKGKSFPMLNTRLETHFNSSLVSSPQEFLTIIILDKPKGRITTRWDDETLAVRATSACSQPQSFKTELPNTSSTRGSSKHRAAGGALSSISVCTGTWPKLISFTYSNTCMHNLKQNVVWFWLTRPNMRKRSLLATFRTVTHVEYL